MSDRCEIDTRRHWRKFPRSGFEFENQVKSKGCIDCARRPLLVREGVCDHMERPPPSYASLNIKSAYIALGFTQHGVIGFGAHEPRL